MIKKIGNILVIVFSILMFGILCAEAFDTEASLFSGPALAVTLAFIFALINIFLKGKIWTILSGIFAIIAGVVGIWGAGFGETSLWDAMTDSSIKLGDWKDWTFAIGVPALFVGGILVLVTAGKDN